MTTHDQRTDTSDAYDEFQPTTPPAEERVQPQQQPPAAPAQHSPEAGHADGQSGGAGFRGADR